MNSMMPTTTLIRRAQVTDADLLAELGARTFSETFAAHNKPEDMSAYLASAFSTQQQAAELEDPQSAFFVAEIEGIAAGYAKLQSSEAPTCVMGESPIELARLYVARDWLGRNVGAALMRAVIDELLRRGTHRTLWLGVWEHNERARAFYRKWGFSDIGEHDFILGEDLQTDVLMARTI